MAKETRDIKIIIEKFKNELRKLGINPQRTILYGSYTKGEQKEKI